jgi:hypothetical protein
VFLNLLCSNNLVHKEAQSESEEFYEHPLTLISFYFQVLRDLGFMFPDLLHVCLPLYELRRSRKERSRLRFTEFLGLMILVFLGFLVCSVL